MKIYPLNKSKKCSLDSFKSQIFNLVKYLGVLNVEWLNLEPYTSWQVLTKKHVVDMHRVIYCKNIVIHAKYKYFGNI